MMSSAPSDRPVGSSFEDRIARIASSLLGSAVMPSDDLFDLGADSVFAMRLAARLRHEEGISLGVGHILRERTTASLARFAVADPGGRPAPEAGTAWEVSPAEEDLCLHEVICPGDPSLLLLSAYELPGDIDLAALRTALVLTCMRHPALSAARMLEADRIRAHARTLDQIDCQLQVHCSDESLDEQDGSVVFPAAWLSRFDLARDLPLRVHVARRADGCRLLGLVMHHVAMDGWSERVFTDELCGAYAEVTGPPGSAPRLPVPPASLLQAAGTAERQRARDHWRTLLGDLEPIPVPLARPGRNSFAQTHLTLTQAQCSALAALSGGHPDLHAGMLAWYADALRHVFDRASFAIGSAYAARDFTEENTIGFYVQMIPVRVDYPPAKTLTSVASDISRQWLASLDQRSLSLRQIAACAPGTRARGHRPVFQAAFALQQHPPPCLHLAGAKQRRLPVHPPAPPFELYLEVWPHSGGRIADLQWDEGSVPNAVARRIAERLRATAQPLSEVISCGQQNGR